MAEHRFLHVGLSPRPASKVKQFEETFNSAKDWMRYAPNCWILYTKQTPARWLERVKPILQEGDTIFICKLDVSERQGWLPKWAWEWLKEDRAEPKSATS